MSHNGFVAAIVAGLFAVALAAPAAAQGVPTTSGGFRAPKQQPVPVDPDAGPPPPALPGAITSGEPADKTVNDLPPTDALFDAINRGDIASARDAISRGADLAGRNILGMSPLDLSVDLSRNDITFLLLSMRGSSPAPVREAAQAPAGAAVLAKPAARPDRLAKPVKLVVTRARPAPATPVVSRQYAGPADPGVPNPQAGFLGFGGSVQ